MLGVKTDLLEFSNMKKKGIRIIILKNQSGGSLFQNKSTLFRRMCMALVSFSSQCDFTKPTYVC